MNKKVLMDVWCSDYETHLCVYSDFTYRYGDWDQPEDPRFVEWKVERGNVFVRHLNDKCNKWLVIDPTRCEGEDRFMRTVKRAFDMMVTEQINNILSEER